VTASPEHRHRSRPGPRPEPATTPPGVVRRLMFLALHKAAMRCLKRKIASRVWRLMLADNDNDPAPTDPDQRRLDKPGRFIPTNIDEPLSSLHSLLGRRRGQKFRGRTPWHSRWNVSAGSRSAFAMMISTNASLHVFANFRSASA